MQRVKLKMCVFALLSLLISLVSCDSLHTPETTPEKDSVWVENVVVHSTAVGDMVFDMVQNGHKLLFNSEQELAELRSNLIRQDYIDRTIRTMPEDVFKYVAHVCIHKYGRVSKETLVNEYLMYKKIYDNLPKDEKPEREFTVEELMKTEAILQQDTVPRDSAVRSLNITINTK